jgi:hypothetical protein
MEKLKLVSSKKEFNVSICDERWSPLPSQVEEKKSAEPTTEYPVIKFFQPFSSAETVKKKILQFQE